MIISHPIRTMKKPCRERKKLGGKGEKKNFMGGAEFTISISYGAKRMFAKNDNINLNNGNNNNINESNDLNDNYNISDNSKTTLTLLPKT